MPGFEIRGISQSMAKCAGARLSRSSTAAAQAALARLAASALRAAKTQLAEKRREKASRGDGANERGRAETASWLKKSIHQTSGKVLPGGCPPRRPQASSQPRWAAPAASVPTTRRMRNPKFGSPGASTPATPPRREAQLPAAASPRAAARPPCRVSGAAPPRGPGAPRSRRTCDGESPTKDVEIELGERPGGRRRRFRDNAVAFADAWTSFKSKRVGLWQIARLCAGALRRLRMLLAPKRERCTRKLGPVQFEFRGRSIVRDDFAVVCDRGHDLQCRCGATIWDWVQI